MVLSLKHVMDDPHPCCNSLTSGTTVIKTDDGCRSSEKKSKKKLHVNVI